MFLWRSSSFLPRRAGLLFNVHINSICTSLKYCKKSHILFVDDFQIWLKYKPLEINSTINHFNEGISSIYQWFIKHGLKPNPLKTQTIILGASANTKLAHTLNHTPLSIKNIPISFNKTVKNLALFKASSSLEIFKNRLFNYLFSIDPATLI